MTRALYLKDKMMTACIHILALLLGCAGLVHAEVMDKEPSLLTNFTWGILGSVFCFLSARYKPPLLLLTGSISAFYFYGLIEELQHPYIGRDIAIEAGGFYVMSGYLLAILVVVSVVAGLILRKKRSNLS